jgi:NAD(P)-dependent dehydrogenase (short-subunit alcohol dehydrogenase family)
VKGLFNFPSASLKPGILQETTDINYAASMSSQGGFAKGPVYCANKHAVIGMGKSAAIGSGKRKI